MKLLEGNLTRGINKSLVLILKAVMCADPSEVSFGDRDFARLYGRTYDNPTQQVPANTPTTIPIRSKAGRA